MNTNYGYIRVYDPPPAYRIMNLQNIKYLYNCLQNNYGEEVIRISDLSSLNCGHSEFSISSIELFVFTDFDIMFKTVLFLGNLLSFLFKPMLEMIYPIRLSESDLSITVKLFEYPIKSAYLRRIKFEKEWNVPPATLLHLSSNILDALFIIS